MIQRKMNQENSGLSKDNSGAENHCTIFTIAESPLNENVIWAEQMMVIFS
jgi:hypothetical protein